MFYEDIWKKWSEHDPVNNVESKAKNLRKLQAIYLDVGIKDEYSLFMGMRTLHAKLTHLIFWQERVMILRNAVDCKNALH